MKIKVVTDSGSGFTKKEAQNLNIDYIPLQVTIQEKSFLDGIYITTEELYAEMKKGIFPQTSQPPLGMIMDLFDQYDKENVTDVILINLSPALSNTNSTICAEAKNHNFKIHTLDIMTTLYVQKYLAIRAIEMVNEGIHPEEIIKRMQECVDKSQGYFVVDDLTHLAKGGRLTPTAAKLAGALKIKPILTLSKETKGRVDTFKKVRTMSKALKIICQNYAEELIDQQDDYILCVAHADAKDHEESVITMLKELLPNVEIVEEQICAVLSCHTGLGTVAIQCVKKI